MTKVLILGDTNPITAGLRDSILVNTTDDVVIYDHLVAAKVQVSAPERETLIDGRLIDEAKLVEAMAGVDVVYLNKMLQLNEVRTVIAAMKAAHVNRLIATTVVGIYGETGGDFGVWNIKQLGAPAIGRLRRCADAVERSGLDYTILRYTWLYEESDNDKFVMVPQNQKFMLAQLSREGLIKGIMEVLTDTSGTYIKANYGIGEPGTIQEKPFFYMDDEDTEE